MDREEDLQNKEDDAEDTSESKILIAKVRKSHNLFNANELDFKIKCNQFKDNGHLESSQILM